MKRDIETYDSPILLTKYERDREPPRIRELNEPNVQFDDREYEVTIRPNPEPVSEHDAWIVRIEDTEYLVRSVNTQGLDMRSRITQTEGYKGLKKLEMVMVVYGRPCIDSRDSATITPVLEVNRDQQELFA